MDLSEIGSLMNFISWNKAYSLYPILTFQGRLGIVTRTTLNNTELFLLEEKLGFETHVEINIPGNFEATSQRTSRHVGDMHCWTSYLCGSFFDTALPFRGRKSELEYDQGNSWVLKTILQQDNCGNMGTHYRLECHPFSSIALLDDYVVSPLVQHLIVPIIDNDVLKLYKRMTQQNQVQYFDHFTQNRYQRRKEQLPVQWQVHLISNI